MSVICGSTATGKLREGVLRYHIHGLNIQARIGEPRLDDALDGLFHRYAVTAPYLNKSMLSCALESRDALPTTPPQADVLYYEGGLRYSALGDRIFIEARNLSISVADLCARHLEVTVATNRIDSTWSIQHFAILPMVMEFLRLEGIYPIHAAALEQEGRALILPAMPGSGKSTLSLALLRAGFGLLSDDMPFLTSNKGIAEVLAFPEDINVCPDSLRFFDELAFLSDRSPNERNKFSFPVEKLFPNALVERANPRLLVFPRIAHTPNSSLERMSQTEAFIALLDHSLPPLNRRLARAHFETALNSVAACRCYRLHTGRDPKEAAALLVEMMSDIP